MHYYCIEYDLFIDNILNENSHFLFFKNLVPFNFYVYQVYVLFVARNESYGQREG